MRFTLIKFAALVAVCLTAMLHTSTSWADRITPELYNRLSEHALTRGFARVVVRMNVPFQAESRLPRSQIALQRSAITEGQSRLLNRLNSLNYRGVKQFRFIPFIAMEVNATALARLNTLTDVLAIEEDSISAANLTDSVPLVGANIATGLGDTGEGQTIAILDTGMDSNHPFLPGKVISEACFSTTSLASNATSVCPNGLSTQVGPGAGINCSNTINGCWHGTHVAGIAAGNGVGRRGVALQAKLISVQVFSRFSGTSCTDFGLPSPCSLSFESDQLRGLEHIYNLRNDFKIAAANMSIGGGSYTSICDFQKSGFKSIIDLLSDADIATVVSAGNDALANATGSPACISSAITIGSTTKFDTISAFSNSAAWVDLLATGSNITSSVIGGGFEAHSGTSMAAPHVAGAWAILKSRWPQATVNEILTALQETGRPVLDPRNNRTISRVQIDTATHAFVQITPGMNILAANLGASVTDSYSLLQALGDPAEIDRLERYDISNGTLQQTFYNANVPAGANSPFSAGEAWIVYANVNKLIHNNSLPPCSDIPLTSGFNLAGYACSGTPIRAYNLLQLFSNPAAIVTVQGVEPRTGRFLSATLNTNGAPAGENFLIQRGSGYILHVNRDVVLPVM